jgi:hypothetical protein
MNCAEAQAWFAALVDGRMALTEWALVEAHLRRCVTCRHEEARLEQEAAARRLVAPTRAGLESLGTAVNATQVGVSRSAALVVRRPVGLMAATLARLAPRVASLAQASGLGVARSIAAIARLRSPALRLTAAARTLAASLEVGWLALARSLDSGVILSRPSLHATKAILALALALFALQRANGPQPYAGPIALPGLETEVTWFWTALGTGVWPARSLAPTSGSPAMPSSSPVPISEAVRGVSFRPSPARGAGVSAFRVIGQLATTDRKAAEPHFTALLARVSGTELGRRHRPTFTTVEVIVPRSRYEDFVQGLARIGSWRLDAARFPLPDAVPMTIRLRG